MSDDELKNEQVLLKRIAFLESEITSLEKDLIHDGLTSLKTRAFFEEETKVYLELVRNVNAGKRRQWFGFKNISILFFDIDHFKSVNDTYGHDAGDEVLKIVAHTIKHTLRQGDTAARWGGEEMVASLLGAVESDAVDKAEKILEEIRNIKFENFPDLKVTASIGVATAESSLSFEDLIKRADGSMYEAKQTGRNKVIAYSQVGK
jgi:diguanylate cyclase (GGDEF)-like protein